MPGDQRINELMEAFFGREEKRPTGPFVYDVPAAAAGLGGGNYVQKSAGGSVASRIAQKIAEKAAEKLFAGSATPLADGFASSSLGTGGTGGAHVGGFTEYLGTEAAAGNAELATPGIDQVIQATPKGGMPVGNNPYIDGPIKPNGMPVASSTAASSAGIGAAEAAITKTGMAPLTGAPVANAAYMVGIPAAMYLIGKYFGDRGDARRAKRQAEYEAAELDPEAMDMTGPVNYLGTAGGDKHWISFDPMQQGAFDYIMQNSPYRPAWGLQDAEGNRLARISAEDMEAFNSWMNSLAEDPGYQFFNTKHQTRNAGDGMYEAVNVTAPEGVEFRVDDYGNVVPLTVDPYADK